jgi:ferrous iron transport protein B
VTILIAPLMTCSARLPVYSLLIAAFIPAQKIGFGVQLQGVILFALYFGGIVSAMAIAWLLKKVMQQKGSFQPLMMELPSYHIPRIKNILLGLWQRMYIFLSRVGGMILLLTVTLWCLASYPVAPVGANLSAVEYSFAGMLGRFLQVIFEPIGFNWQISLALVPGLAAREVVVSSLGTVYALSGTESDIAQALIPLLSHGWSLATALSLLMWFVFAPQCLSTLAAVRRETGGLMIPLVMLLYLFGLAYLASFLTYRLAVSWGLG